MGVVDDEDSDNDESSILIPNADPDANTDDNSPINLDDSVEEVRFDSSDEEDSGQSSPLMLHPRRKQRRIDSDDSDKDSEENLDGDSEESSDEDSEESSDEDSEESSDEDYLTEDFEDDNVIVCKKPHFARD